MFLARVDFTDEDEDLAVAEKLGPVLVCALGHKGAVNGILVLARAEGAASWSGL
jgi:two-component system, NarL family, sensor histidine kinase DevS